MMQLLCADNLGITKVCGYVHTQCILCYNTHTNIYIYIYIYVPLSLGPLVRREKGGGEWYPLHAHAP